MAQRVINSQELKNNNESNVKLIESLDVNFVFNAGGFYWSLKQQVNANRKLKGLGGNVLDTVQIYLIDPDTITAFYKQQDKYTKSIVGLDMFKLFIGDRLVADGELDAFESITGEVVGRLFLWAGFSEYHIEGESATSFMNRIGARISAEISFFDTLLERTL